VETLFDCPVYRSYGKAIADQVYRPASFRLSLGLKDIRLVLQAAEDARVSMPFALSCISRCCHCSPSVTRTSTGTPLGYAVSRSAGLELRQGPAIRTTQ
jgi:hypothetical protein